MIDFIIENSLYFILIAVTLCIIGGYYTINKLRTERDRKLELIFGIPAAVSIILVAYNLILSTNSDSRIEENRVDQITLENNQRNWLDPQLDLAASYPEGFFLYRSITPDADHGPFEPETYDPALRKQIEISSSIRFFQAMEDYLTIGAHDLTESNIYVNNFLMWMQSPILRKNWEALSFNYSKDTREMMRRLIEAGDELIARRNAKGKLSNEDYDTISEKFVIHFR